MAQDEEMRALQRENGGAGQRMADLRERLNFQCFKYELLVDMVCACLRPLRASALNSSKSLTTDHCTLPPYTALHLHAHCQACSYLGGAVAVSGTS